MLDETSESSWREVRFRHSGNFLPLLAESRMSLLVTTYQAGKVLAIGTRENALHIEAANFELAMGLARHPHRVAVGTRECIWFLQPAPDLAPRMNPGGEFDQALIARQCHVTGDTLAHELEYHGDELWMVNTLFSCLCTIDDRYSFVPRWKPPFVSSCHEPGDRCHLNGVAMGAEGPAYVTAVAETDAPNEWRAHKAAGGCVVDVKTHTVVARGLAMPHSPRLYADRLWVLNSGRGELCSVDTSDGKLTTVERLPGYTRGLDFLGPLAFVGISKIRETAVFGELPISESRQERKCGIGVVDLRSGRTIATLEFETGVEEIFEVRVLAGSRCVALRGPSPEKDGHDTIWVVPPP